MGERCGGGIIGLTLFFAHSLPLYISFFLPCSLGDIVFAASQARTFRPSTHIDIYFIDDIV